MNRPVVTLKQNLMQSKVVRVEVRAGGGLHGPEKPGLSVGGMEKQPGNVKTTTTNITKTAMNEKQQPTSQNPPGGSPKQSTIAGSFGDLQTSKEACSNFCKRLEVPEIARK